VPRPLLRTQDRNGRLTIESYAPTFLAQHRLSEGGRRFYGLIIKNDLTPNFTGPMIDVRSVDVRRYLRELEADGKSGALIRKVLTVASSMWNDAMDEDPPIVTENPWLGHGKKVKSHVAKAKRVMTPEEFHLLVETISPEYSLLVRTLGESGLRWTEAMRLQPEHVIDNVIHVVQSKNGKPRQIHINAELAALLRAALPFRNSVGVQVKYHTFRKRHWDVAVEAMSGLPGIPFTPHSLRASFASWPARRWRNAGRGP